MSDQDLASLRRALKADPENGDIKLRLLIERSRTSDPGLLEALNHLADFFESVANFACLCREVHENPREGGAAGAIELLDQVVELRALGEDSLSEDLVYSLSLIRERLSDSSRPPVTKGRRRFGKGEERYGSVWRVLSHTRNFLELELFPETARQGPDEVLHSFFSGQVGLIDWVQRNVTEEGLQRRVVIGDWCCEPRPSEDVVANAVPVFRPRRGGFAFSTISPPDGLFSKHLRRLFHLNYGPWWRIHPTELDLREIPFFEVYHVETSTGWYSLDFVME